MTTRPSQLAPTRAGGAGPDPIDRQAGESSWDGAGLVLVGVDGSGCARRAASWAADQAVRSRSALQLVHAYHLPPAAAPDSASGPRVLAELRDEGNAVLGGTAAALRRRHPGLEISTVVAYGDPAAVLRRISGAATLTVVGKHGGETMTVGLGSVAAAVAATSPSPVAVIHGGSPNRTGPVVVGVDGSPTGKGAAALAFQIAADRRATLLAVRCWTNEGSYGPIPRYSEGVVDPADIQAEEQHRLTTELSDLLARYPGVRVERAVIHRRPTAGLLGYTDSAQLIVAGSHGHRGVTGLLLGSTSQALIARSSCPVVIARRSAAT